MDRSKQETFRQYVEENEDRYGIPDCTYCKCVAEFGELKIMDLDKQHEIRILRPFFLIWGGMGRVLGYEGVKGIREKLKLIGSTIEPRRHDNLLAVDLDGIRDPITNLFDEIKETKFMNRKGIEKRVGSTAASKTLHLACPDLFLMWDSDIRVHYKKRHGNGKDYFLFLTEMKLLWREMETAIADMQLRYGKRETKIIDQYNWIMAHKKAATTFLSRD